MGQLQTLQVPPKASPGRGKLSRKRSDETDEGAPPNSAPKTKNGPAEAGPPDSFLRVAVPGVCCDPWAGLASCRPLPQQLLPVPADGGGRRRCTWRTGEQDLKCASGSPLTGQPPDMRCRAPQFSRNAAAKKRSCRGRTVKLHLKINQRLENWGARRAAFRPYFLRSFIRGSRVRKPAFFSTGRFSSLCCSRARLRP